MTVARAGDARLAVLAVICRKNTAIPERPTQSAPRRRLRQSGYGTATAARQERTENYLHPDPHVTQRGVGA